MKEQDRLVEVDGAIFDRVLLEHSFGFENLDVVGRESFVNHTHFEGQDRVSAALELAESWRVELLRRWPAYTFRLYWHDNEVEDEIIIRFHRVYPGILNWCDDPLPDLRITEISA